MDYLAQLTLDDLPAEQKSIAETIGLEAFQKLVRVYGGLTLYVPKADAFRRNYRNDEIRTKFTGNNYRELAREYDLSEQAVRLIVAELDKEMRSKPVDGQLSLL